MRETRYVHRLPVATPTLYPAVATNVYLVEDAGEVLVIDAGYENRETADFIIQYISRLNAGNVLGIVLTHHHRDHSPGARALADFFGCPILCHPFEAQTIEEKIAPRRIDSTLQDGDAIQVGNATITVLHAPGHTHGHLNLLLEQERVLFSGDNIVAEGTTWIGPPDGDLIAYLATLRRLQELQPALIAPGHGEIVRNPAEKIRFFIERRLEREQQILGLLARKPSTVDELVQAVYQNQVHPGVLWVAERTILGHLEKLQKEQKVVSHGNRFRLA